MKLTLNQISAIQNVQKIFDLRENLLNILEIILFLLSEAEYKAKYGSGLKILTSKQMLQKLPVALAQLKAGNTSQNLLNEIRQIIYSLHRAKEINKRSI